MTSFSSRRDVVVLVVVAALVLLYALTTSNELHNAVRDGRLLDFGVFWNAARVADSGGDLYGFHTVAKTFPYLYPPAAAALLYPLTALSYNGGLIAWFLVQMLSLAVMLYVSTIIIQRLGVARPLLVVAMGAALSTFVLDTNLFWGQVNLPVMAVVVAGVAAYQSDRPATAGALFAVATSIKLLPVLFLFWFIARRDWRAIRAFLAAIIVLTLMLPAIVGGLSWSVEANIAWLHKLLSGLVAPTGDELGRIHQTANGSFVAVFGRLFGPEAKAFHLPAGVVAWLVRLFQLGVFVGTMVAIATARKRQRLDGSSWVVAAVMLVVGGWLVNVFIWGHYTIGLVFVVVILAGVCSVSDSSERTDAALLSALFAAILVLASGFPEGSKKFGIQTLCLLVCWAGTAIAVASGVSVREPVAEE